MYSGKTRKTGKTDKTGKTGMTAKTALLLRFYKNEPVVTELMWSFLSEIYSGGPALNIKN